MPKSTTKKTSQPATTAQKLGSTIKSARDKMRIDKGLNGELDRLPQLTWMMFLKLLDDAEKLLEVEAELTVKDWQILQTSIVGAEAKSLPLMLAHMNLLLNGFEYPDIDTGNSLRFNLAEMGEKDWVDVILTNPPFGGEEEDSIKKNFPPDRSTKETALLFLMLIMRRLRESKSPNPPTPLKSLLRGGAGGRAAVVFPNGVLFGDGACAKIKEDLLKDYNLHTIVRLPNGVFATYTSIPTNILFFDRSQPTDEIWYYEISLPDGRKNYTDSGRNFCWLSSLVEQSRGKSTGVEVWLSSRI